MERVLLLVLAALRQKARVALALMVAVVQVVVGVAALPPFARLTVHDLSCQVAEEARPLVRMVPLPVSVVLATILAPLDLPKAARRRVAVPELRARQVPEESALPTVRQESDRTAVRVPPALARAEVVVVASSAEVVVVRPARRP
jgi:hypothetical protein